MFGNLGRFAHDRRFRLTHLQASASLLRSNHGRPLSGNLMTLRRRDFGPPSRSDDEQYSDGYGEEKRAPRAAKKCVALGALSHRGVIRFSDQSLFRKRIMRLTKSLACGRRRLGKLCLSVGAPCPHRRVFRGSDQNEQVIWKASEMPYAHSLVDCRRNRVVCKQLPLPQNQKIIITSGTREAAIGAFRGIGSYISQRYE